MKSPQIPLLFLVSLAAFSTLWVSCGKPSVDVKIPQNLILERVDKKFPMTVNKGLYTLEILNPKVELNGRTGRIDIEADTVTRVFGLVPVSGRVLADASVEFRAGPGTIHITDLKVRDYELGDGAKPDGKKEEVMGFLADSIAGSLNGLEVYQLDSRDRLEKLAKSHLKKIRVSDKAVVVTLGL
ncbi:MAG: DUF1439 domain-containing protein [Verrucomicrobiae bacterium]|nr:DUF1439 domain-containing protein [Verrucomicrobiae bacterium]